MKRFVPHRQIQLCMVFPVLLTRSALQCSGPADASEEVTKIQLCRSRLAYRTQAFSPVPLAVAIQHDRHALNTCALDADLCGRALLQRAGQLDGQLCAERLHSRNAKM